MLEIEDPFKISTNLCASNPVGPANRSNPPNPSNSPNRPNKRISDRTAADFCAHYLLKSKILFRWHKPEINLFMHLLYSIHLPKSVFIYQNECRTFKGENMS